MKTCPSCGEQASDGLLCATETVFLEKDLQQLPGLMRELQITYTRQSQAGSGNGSKSADTVVPFDNRASVVSDSVVNTIGTWIRALNEGHNDITRVICTCVAPSGPCDLPEISMVGTTMRSWTIWLLNRIQRIRGHEAVNELVRDIGGAVQKIKSVIDLPEERLFVINCTVCATPVYAVSEDQVDIPCGRCERIVAAGGGAQDGYVPKYDARPNRDKMRALIMDSLVTRHEMTTTIPMLYAVEIREGMFDSWVKRNELPRRGSRAGHGLYSVRTAVELATRAMQQPRKRRSA